MTRKVQGNEYNNSAKTATFACGQKLDEIKHLGYLKQSLTHSFINKKGCSPRNKSSKKLNRLPWSADSTFFLVEEYEHIYIVKGELFSMCSLVTPWCLWNNLMRKGTSFEILHNIMSNCREMKMIHLRAVELTSCKLKHVQDWCISRGC